MSQRHVGFYLWHAGERAYLPRTIDVLRIAGGVIAEITTFLSTGVRLTAHSPAAKRRRGA